MERTTIAVTKIDYKFCLNPHFAAKAFVSIVIPKGGQLISPNPADPSPNLVLASDGDGQWTPWVNHPNLSKPSWMAQGEEDGKMLYGWSIENADENLQRGLKCEFKWMGDGPHVTETYIDTRHGCSQYPRPPHGGVAGTWVEVGLALPDGAAVKGFHYAVAEGNGNWNYVVNAPPPYLRVGWNCEGLAGWPSIPGHNYWGFGALNEHSVNARYIRVSVDAP